MLVIGITGGPGTGKSTVAAMFAELGAAVLDADAIAHALMRADQPAWAPIVERFGQEILAGREIDRTKLAGRVFRDAAARRQLEAIVHPLVERRMREELERLRGAGRCKAAVLDVPLLLETGGRAMVDLVVVVHAPPDVARQRLAARGWSDEETAGRTAAQWDLPTKMAMADAVIENGNGLDQTRRHVTQLWNRLWATRPHA